LLQQAVKRGQRELVRGNVKAAHTAFCEAVLLGQASELILIGLTQVLLMQSDTEAALKTVDQLLALEPDDRVALDLRGDILIRMGRADEARETWFRAAGASRVSASLIDNLRRANRADAVKAVRAGDLARADRLWRRVIALDVRDVEASTQLAAVLAKDGKLDAAKRWLVYAETLDPTHPKLISLKSALGV
jgi:Flp pilus assembly protein TadD